MSQDNELSAVKRRIRALSEKTIDNGATEAEAFSAMEKIGSLLSQFNLSMTEVLLSQEKVIKKEFLTTSKQRSIEFDLCMSVAKLCQIKTWYIRSFSGIKIIYFGFESDVDMAIYLTDMISKSYKTSYLGFKQSKDYINFPYHRKTLLPSFLRGFKDRINVKIGDIISQNDVAEKKAAEFHREEMKSRMVSMSDEAAVKFAQQTTGTALISLTKLKMVEQEFKKMGMNLKTANISINSRHNTAAYGAGSSAASNVNLSRPITRSNATIAGYLT